MVVCRFFQQGYCRFGQNCRFEHIYGSKYTYHANQSQQKAPVQSTPGECTDEQLVNQVQSDVQSALRGGQWILSCYAPFKEKPIYPGLSDLSPEEARLFIYEAKNSNNLEQAVNYMNNLYKETQQKYEQLLQPNVNVIKVLRSLYKGETISYSNTSQNTFSSNDAASSIFRNAVQNTQPTQNNPAATIFSQGQQSIFNNKPDQAKELFSKANSSSIFGQNSTSVNAFGSPNQNESIAKSIFASAVQNNQFGATNQANPSSLFSAANHSIFGSNQSTSPFGQTQNASPFSQSQNTSPFSQNQNTSPFSQNQNTSAFDQTKNVTSFNQNVSPFNQNNNTSPFHQGNVFQKTENLTSIFNQANNQLEPKNDSGIYSKIEDLSEEDLEAFNSDHFELGFVPELPPPLQLCTRAC